MKITKIRKEPQLGYIGPSSSLCVFYCYKQQICHECIVYKGLPKSYTEDIR